MQYSGSIIACEVNEVCLDGQAKKIQKKPVDKRAFFFQKRAAPRRPTAAYAAANQYPALNGLLIRKAKGDTSIKKSPGSFSAIPVKSVPAVLCASVPLFA